MFFNTAIASVETPLGVLELCSESTVKITKSAVDNFSFKLAAPYQVEGKFYRFKLNLPKDIDLEAFDQNDVMSDMISSFDKLIKMPEVVRRFGKITYHGSTTRRYVKAQLTQIVFGRKEKLAAMEM
jgi:hypothetical protein